MSKEFLVTILGGVIVLFMLQGWYILTQQPLQSIKPVYVSCNGLLGQVTQCEDASSNVVNTGLEVQVLYEELILDYRARMRKAGVDYSSLADREKDLENAQLEFSEALEAVRKIRE
jgi:hypothetical protein